jgi:CheY-like chemotaxis protein
LAENFINSDQSRPLIVDDNELNLSPLLDMLKGLGVFSIIAEPCSKIIEFANRHGLSLILLYVEILEMDEFHALKLFSIDAILTVRGLRC